MEFYTNLLQIHVKSYAYRSELRCSTGARSFPHRLFPADLFPYDFSLLCLFPDGFFSDRSFPFRVFPVSFSTTFFLPAGTFPVILFKQGNKPNHIISSQTNLKPSLTISNLTQPTLTQSTVFCTVT